MMIALLERLLPRVGMRVMLDRARFAQVWAHVVPVQNITICLVIITLAVCSGFISPNAAATLGSVIFFIELLTSCFCCLPDSRKPQHTFKRREMCLCRGCGGADSRGC
jgi:hypothetical protein